MNDLKWNIERLKTRLLFAKGITILVEGISDKNFYEKILKNTKKKNKVDILISENFESNIKGAKNVVIEVINKSNNDDKIKNKVKGIIDKDFDVLLNKKQVINNLYYTDGYCYENYLIDEDLFNESFPKLGVQVDFEIDESFLLEAIENFSIFNYVFLLNFDTNKIDFDSTFDNNKIYSILLKDENKPKIDLENFKKQTKSRIQNIDEFFEKANKMQINYKQNFEPKKHIHGKYFLNFIICFFKNNYSKKQRPIDEFKDKLEDIFVINLKYENTNLYKNLFSTL